MQAGVSCLMINHKPCVVIPVYNHEQAITHMVTTILSYQLTCILIDDGSDNVCAKALDQLTALFPDNVILLRHSYNSGKGSAVMTGIRHAFKMGFTHALQIDADGQHCTTDITRFLSLSSEHPSSIIIGCPIYDHTVPRQRLYARYLTHIWVWINTLSRDIKDSMCGFRVYPLLPIIDLDHKKALGGYMDFDSEILVRLHWKGLNMINLPTAVTYPQNGISHFRLIRDNVLISRMHARLFLGMLWRLPYLLARKLR